MTKDWLPNSFDNFCYSSLFSIKNYEHIFCACWNGDIETVKKFLWLKNQPINELFSIYPETPFYAACGKGHTEIVKLLLAEESLNPNVKDDHLQNFTPLMKACDAGHIEIVKLLLDDPRVDVAATASYGTNALLLARIRCFDEKNPEEWKKIVSIMEEKLKPVI